MACQFACTKSRKTPLLRAILGRVCLFASAFGVIAAQSSSAHADELEDMLVRLAALGTGQTNGDTPLTAIVGANGIHGAVVSGSANGSQGIMALNQDAGPGGANQGNIVVIAVTSTPNAAAIARLLAEQTYVVENRTPLSSEPFPTQLAALAIVDSYRGGSGIAQVNQSAGQGNVQLNATLIAAALGGGDALAVSEADLSSLGSFRGTARAGEGQRGATSIAGSFTDFSGIVQVNQTIGTGNVVSNTVSLTYTNVPAGGG